MIKVCFVADGELNVDLMEKHELATFVGEMMEVYEIELKSFKFLSRGEWRTLEELLLPVLDEVLPRRVNIGNFTGEVLYKTVKDGKTEYMAAHDNGVDTRIFNETELQSA